MVTESRKVIGEDRRLREEGATSLQPAETQGISREGIEDIDPRLIQQLVSLDENEVIVPLRMKREEVSKVKAVKLSDDEVVSVSKFQLYLHDRGYLRDNTFASLFCYIYNLAFTLHSQLVDEEIRKEGAD